jgi:hypothetical protein
LPRNFGLSSAQELLAEFVQIFEGLDHVQDERVVEATAKLGFTAFDLEGFELQRLFDQALLELYDVLVVPREQRNLARGVGNLA